LAGLPGSIQPAGIVEFLDNGEPIPQCSSRPVFDSGATCTVTYGTSGNHSVVARYAGDRNFSGSSSSTAPVNVVAPAAGHPQVFGTITSTMQWTFFFSPAYTKVMTLLVNGVPPRATVTVGCRGARCPFKTREHTTPRTVLCGKKKHRHRCPFPGIVNLASEFGQHRLPVGTRITVALTKANWIGKYYRFTIRARRGPRVQIGCLAPGATSPGRGC
jgi:hypothetical protein